MDPLFLSANDLGIRLEIVGDLPIWEPHPLYRHQKAVRRIEHSIERGARTGTGGDCECITVQDVYVQFPDGSLKRPDIAIFRREPEEEDTPVTLVPEAVIEVISKGYEAKDLQLAPPFYLAHGVKDIVVFDPRSSRVLHVRAGGTAEYTSPVELELLCGCRCTV